MLRLNNKLFLENTFLMLRNYTPKEQNQVTSGSREFSFSRLSYAACVVVTSINAPQNAESALLNY